MTLVEMLVVVMIVAVMAGVTALAIGGRLGGSAGEEAERLAARLRLAADDVRLDERRLAFAWDRTGYGFVDWDARARAWRDDRVEALAHHDLPRGMTLQGAGESGRVPLNPDGTGGAIDLRIGTSGGSWKIHFDGLDAVATAS